MTQHNLLSRLPLALAAAAPLLQQRPGFLVTPQGSQVIPGNQGLAGAAGGLFKLLQQAEVAKEKRAADKEQRANRANIAASIGQLLGPQTVSPQPAGPGLNTILGGGGANIPVPPQPGAPQPGIPRQGFPQQTQQQGNPNRAALLRSAQAFARAGDSAQASALVKEALKPGPQSLARIQAEAGAKKTGQLEARAANINKILNAAGPRATPLPSPTAIHSGAVAGPDARTLTRMLATAQKLNRAGESSLAGNILSQARAFAENSPEIQKSRALNKPLSVKSAAELGVPVGTTMGEVTGITPKSPVQSAREIAIARAEGKQVTKDTVQAGFIGEARIVISGLLKEIKTDPGIVGIRGSLRATGKTAIGVLSDLGATDLVNTAREIALTQTELSLDQQRGLFDSPTLSVLQTIENSVGLILARVRSPVGRLQVAVINLSLQDMKLRGLTSSRQVVDRLTFVDNFLKLRQQRLSGKTAKLPRYRVKDGRLERVR